MTTKTADNKGRIVLGPRFANKTVIVEEIDETEVRITVAAVVPQRELWLHRNPNATAAVERGLAQARAGKFAKKPPDLKKDAALVKKLND
jgi:predicted transcriptional regulator